MSRTESECTHGKTLNTCRLCGETMRGLRERVEELENLLAEGVHSCSHLCKRPMCVLRRENQELKAEVAALKADIHAFLGHPCGKTVQDLRKAILDGEDD